MPQTIVQEVDLTRLSKPAYDVRDSRDPDELRSLAQSMDQQGQLQPAMVYPENWELIHDDESDIAGLQDAVDMADEFFVVDGWSRYRAAKDVLDWPSLRCEIHSRPPADQIPASLDANVMRLEMDDYELAQSLQEWKERTGMTYQEMEEKLPMAASTIRNYVNALDVLPEIRQAWSSDQAPIKHGHVMHLRRLPTDDLQLAMLDRIVEYEMSVSRAREHIEEAKREFEQEQKQGEDEVEEPAEVQEQKAEARARKRVERAKEQRTCTVCGEQADRKVALDVCAEDYGLIKKLEETDQALIQQAAEGQGQDHGPAQQPR